MDCATYFSEKVSFAVNKLSNGELQVDVKSGHFAGRYDFCIEDENLITYAKRLQKINDNLEGEFNFADMDSDSFILFKMKHYGKMEVSGQLGSFVNGNYLNFLFEADQTLLTSLIGLLQSFEC